MDGLTVDESAGRAEVKTRVGEVVDVAPAFHWNSLTHFLDDGIRILAPVAVGVDRPRHHSVRSNAIGAEFLSDRLGEAMHAGLRRDVVGAVQQVAREPVVT